MDHLMWLGIFVDSHVLGHLGPALLVPVRVQLPIEFVQVLHLDVRKFGDDEQWTPRSRDGMIEVSGVGELHDIDIEACSPGIG